MRIALLAVFSMLSLAACGSTSAGSDAGTFDAAPSQPDAGIGPDVTVTAFDGTPVYFTGDDNQRQVDTTVSFPAAGLHFSSITLHLALRCPSGGCDPWDRLGHISLVREDAEGEHEIELARFITPYHVGMSADYDLTDLQRLLGGDATLRVFIDTWVGPGSPYGDGWLVDASFEFVGGIPEHDPIAVIPLWSPQGVVYGDPARPIDVSADVTIPEGATGARLWALVTGHGQGNADQCAEFCSKEHTFTVGEQAITRAVWRTDCATTAAPGQEGTYQYSRSGWCPGASVETWTADIDDVTPGPLHVTYDVEDYVNTCRPDSDTCTGCTLGTACEYDDGAHTEPFWEQSALLVVYGS
jgi:hypothetical protein